MELYGFHFRYRLCGQPPTVREFYFKDTEKLTLGDLVNVESGEVDLAATNDSAIVGAVIETLDGIDSTTRIKVVVDADAVYAVSDNNVRLMGATLDITGTTGAMTVTTDSNHDVVVVANSAADEPTLVMIVQSKHPLF